MRTSRRAFLASAGVGATHMGFGASVGTAGEASERRLPLIATYVAGSDRYAAPTVAQHLTLGDVLRLRREPENGYDGRAVSIWTRDGQQKLGYVPRIHNQALANLMDAGLAAEARVADVKGLPGRPDISLTVVIALPT